MARYQVAKTEMVELQGDDKVLARAYLSRTTQPAPISDKVTLLVERIITDDEETNQLICLYIDQVTALEAKTVELADLNGKLEETAERLLTLCDRLIHGTAYANPEQWQVFDWARKEMVEYRKARGNVVT